VEYIQTIPALLERALNALRDRGAKPFEAHRFSRLPAQKQVFGLALLETDETLTVPELLERVEAL
jgi:hypothetical protein